MSQEHVVPIREAINDRINASGLYLPNYLDREIGIDMDKTTRLMNIGGIHHLQIVNQTTQEETPAISGFDSQGNATAAVTKVAEKEASDTSTTDNLGLRKAGKWVSLKVGVDTQKIAEDALKKGRDELKVSANWAPKINNKVRQTIISHGTKHSLFPSSHINDYLYDITSIGETYVVLSTGGRYMEANIVALGFLYLAQREKLRERHNSNNRYDVLYSTHLVRAALSQSRGRTAYRTIIAPMEKEEK